MKTSWAIAALLMALGCSSQPQVQPPRPVATAAPKAVPSAGNCVKYIELHDAKYLAKEWGRTEAWMLANHRVSLWEGPSPQKKRPVGQMLVGSRASIIEESANDYRVTSPLDQSVGWVSKVQVARTLFQDTKTFKPCVAEQDQLRQHSKDNPGLQGDSR